MIHIETKTIPIGPWAVNHTGIEMPIAAEILNSIPELLSKWSSAFPDENTWVRQSVGIPSLIVRLDATFNHSGVQIYEVEERPSGIGISFANNPSFADKLNSVRNTWPDIAVVVSSQRAGTDDYLWAPIIGVEEADKFPGILIVRAEPEEFEYHHLSCKSASSVVAKGDKSYGETLGWWTNVKSPEEINWEEPFALKPLKGSKAHGVEIWHPDPKMKRELSATTRSRVLRALADNPNGMYHQPFIAPQEVVINGQTLRMIHRIFFAFDLSVNTWVPLGGSWVARPNVKVHGASDSIVGQIKID